MVVRKDSKKKKYLGTRTRGAGNTKNRRGAGYKGGKGRTGKWKHKKVKYIDEIGTKVRQKPKTIEKAISLYDLNQYIEKHFKDKKDIVLDFKENKDLKKYDKIVGYGNLKYKVTVKNVKLSKTAEDKIKKLGE